MKKALDFIKAVTPLKMFITGCVLGLVATFIEKPLPGIFLGLRLLSFILCIGAIIKYFNRK